ncbi:hypothetical protein FACS189425_03990 [Clostridia bacterium]|nr:hypothetical protein FACS189425_03990 [Clostridia bacterium]
MDEQKKALALGETRYLKGSGYVKLAEDGATLEFQQCVFWDAPATTYDTRDKAITNILLYATDAQVATDAIAEIEQTRSHTLSKLLGGKRLNRTTIPHTLKADKPRPQRY